MKLALSGDEEDLAPGVKGIVFEEAGILYIGVLAATTPFNGDVGRYLDSIPKSKTVRVMDVMEPILEGMLERRGYDYVEVPAEEIEEFWCVVEDTYALWEREGK